MSIASQPHTDALLIVCVDRCAFFVESLSGVVNAAAAFKERVILDVNEHGCKAIADA